MPEKPTIDLKSKVVAHLPEPAREHLPEQVDATLDNVILGFQDSSYQTTEVYPGLFEPALIGNSGEVDYFVFDFSNVSPSFIASGNEHYIVGFEQNLDQIVYTNYDPTTSGFSFFSGDMGTTLGYTANLDDTGMPSGNIHVNLGTAMSAPPTVVYDPTGSFYADLIV